MIFSVLIYYLHRDPYDVGKPIPAHENLARWAQQRALLLNVPLTVRARNPPSHQTK